MTRIDVTVCFIGLILIVVYTVLASEGFTYDEPHYLSNLTLIEKHGIGFNFIRNMKGPAGPLYAYIHYGLSPLTNGEVVLTRLVNIALALMTVWLLILSLKKILPDQSNAAWLIFVIPMTFPCAGMALTEFPSILFFALSLTLIVVTLSENVQSRQSVMLRLATAGFALSIAIVGRQPFLLCVGGVIAIYAMTDRAAVKAGVVLYCIAALALPTCLFYIWGSTAPNVEGAAASSGLIRPIHFFLSLGYALLVILFLAPAFLAPVSRRLVFIYASLAVAITFFNSLIDYSYPIGQVMTSRYLSPPLSRYFGYFMTANLVLAGVYFAYSLVLRTIEHKHDMLFVTFALMLIFMLGSNALITHQFSSRYVLQAAPLFVLLAAYYQKPDWRKSVMHVAGVVVGILSLMNYY